MIVVIQCAARKNAKAGYLRTKDGRPVLFVARPDSAPMNDHIVYARPDDSADTGRTWREELLIANRDPQNAAGLVPAVNLYENPVYADLARELSPDRLFILSAGWGLVPASFLTPVYDITFSSAAHHYKRRRGHDRYENFRMLPPDAKGPILFFGGSDYVPYFASLTSDAASERIVFYNSTNVPRAPGCRTVRFETATRTNWHYECARAFLSGKLAIT